jgi:hypothetical protein
MRARLLLLVLGTTVASFWPGLASADEAPITLRITPTFSPVPLRVWTTLQLEICAGSDLEGRLALETTSRRRRWDAGHVDLAAGACDVRAVAVVLEEDGVQLLVRDPGGRVLARHAWSGPTTGSPAVALLGPELLWTTRSGGIELRTLLQQIRRLGKTILLSSHILPELEPLCDGVAILAGGRVVAAGDMAAIARRATEAAPVLDLRFAAPAREAARVLADLGLASEVTAEGALGARVSLRLAGGDAAVADLVVRLSAAGLPPVGIAPQRAGLEGAFLDLTGGGPPCA